MIWHTGALALVLQGATAFPSVFNHLDKRQQAQEGCSVSSLCDAPFDVSDEEAGTGAFAGPLAAQSKARTNCGFLGAPCTEFDATAQYISTSGDNEFQAPVQGQIRGPCPGLNAAANHGYLPRSGVLTIQDTVDGLQTLYNMAVDLGAFLAVYAIAFDGDVLSGTWSIGGPHAVTIPGILGQPQGISYSHNKYEGDSSIGRCDAYINGGDAHSLSTTRFAYAFAAGMDNDRYTLDKFSQEFAKNTIRSIGTNPLYFAPLFSTTLVSPAAYNFVINFMSNHTAEEPAGYFNGDMFKTFFSITGDYPNFKWNPGYERIPENWYKRPAQNQYTIASVFGDLAPEFLAYPNSFRFGGNTNGINTYAGIDLDDLTGGVFNASNLFEGNNLACFFYQNQQQALFDELTGGLNDVTAALNLVSPQLASAFADLGCPEISAYNDNTFTQYPGHTYSPTGAANLC